MSEPRISVSCVSSCAGYPDDCKSPEIFYLGKWRKLGERVPYDNAKGWRKYLRFPIVYIGKAAAQLELPNWYGFGFGWGSFKGTTRATIIGNTIEPKKDMPEWMNK